MMVEKVRIDLKVSLSDLVVVCNVGRSKQNAKALEAKPMKRPSAKLLLLAVKLLYQMERSES